MNKSYRFTIKNLFGHLHLVNQHRFKVFLLCCRAGIPWRGLVHDLSKYSPVEFFEGVKYFAGDYSPISNCKKEKGFSPAWVHHFGRNKHHYEYWYDYTSPIKTPLIPYPYMIEMICDSLAAGLVYQKEHWTKDYQLSYWLRVREKAKVHPKVDLLLTKVYTDISKDGLKAVIRRKNLKMLYQRFMN